MGDTIEFMDIELEQKDNKNEFLENEIGLADSKFIEEGNKLGLKKISSKRKGDRILYSLTNSPNNHNYIEKTIHLNFSSKVLL